MSGRMDTEGLAFTGVRRSAFPYFVKPNVKTAGANGYVTDLSAPQSSPKNHSKYLKNRHNMTNFAQQKMHKSCTRPKNT